MDRIRSLFTPKALTLALAMGLIALMPEAAAAQDIGVNKAFDGVTSGLINPIVLGVRGLAMLAAVCYGLFAVWKAIKEASGKEMLIAVGMFFFALFMYNPTLLTNLLGLEIAGLEKYGIKSGF